MAKVFHKIWIIGVLAVVLAGGFFAWQNGWLQEASNNFSVVYTSENFAWGENIQRIEVSKDGRIAQLIKTGVGKKDNSGVLSEEELKELSSFIVSNKFFDLPADLTNPLCADAPTEYLEITIGKKIHRAGGGCVENETFRVIAEKLEEIIKNKINNNEIAGWKI